MNTQSDESTQTTHNADEPFVIGCGIGPVGRWFRLFLGVYTLIFLVLNRFYLHPVALQVLPAFVLSVAGYLLLIVALHFGVFALWGESVASKLNPWARTAAYIGIFPIVFAFLRILPPALQEAMGLYWGISLILLFLMRYGGCELIALPALVLKRRFAVYCPFNAIDAIERAVTPDKSWSGNRPLMILSLAIIVFVGGYFILVVWNDLLGQTGIAIHIDRHWSLLLLVPCIHFAALALKEYRARRSFAAPLVRKYALGALFLGLAIVVSIFPGHGVSNGLWRIGMGLGVIFALYKIGARMVRRV